MRKLSMLVFCLLPATAAAQSSTTQIEEIRKDAKIHIGPFYLRPVIQLKELGVDTNIFNEQQEQNSDFMFNLSPRLDAWLPFRRRALVTTSIGTDLLWYARYKSERAVNPQIKVRGELFLHRLTLFAQDALSNNKQRANYEIDLRSRYVDKTFSAGAAYQVTPKFSVEASGRRSLFDYDRDAVVDGTRLEETLDRATTGFAAVIRHKLTPLSTLVLDTERFKDDFIFSPQRDTSSLRVLPGVEFKPRASISGEASIGFRRFQPERNDAFPGYTGVVAKAGLWHTLRGATTVGVRLARDISYSFERLQPYFLNTSGGASVRRAIGRRFDAIASADRHRYAYRDLKTTSSLVDGLVEDRIDTTWNYATSLGFRFNRSTRMGFGVSYWQRKSTTKKLRDYDGLRIGSTVTYGIQQ